MSLNVKRRARGLVAVLPVAAGALGVASLAGACAPQQVCTQKSPSCACPNDPASGPDITLLVPGGSAALTRAVSAITAHPGAITKKLGSSGDPTVEVETYGDDGSSLTSLGTFPLAGKGASDDLLAADQSMQRSCLADAVKHLPASSAKPDVIFAIHQAASAAEASGDRGAAIVAFGLGQSFVASVPVSKIDLTTTASRAGVITTLRNDEVIRAKTTVPLVLVQPDAGIDNPEVGGDVAAFAQNLCAALSTDCSSSAALPE